MVRPSRIQKDTHLFSRIWHNLKGTPVQDGVVTDDHRRHGCRNGRTSYQLKFTIQPGRLMLLDRNGSCRDDVRPSFEQYATSTNAGAVSVDAPTHTHTPEPCRDGIALVLIVSRFCSGRGSARKLWHCGCTICLSVVHFHYIQGQWPRP